MLAVGGTGLNRGGLTGEGVSQKDIWGKGSLGRGSMHKGLWLDHSWLPLSKHYLLRICRWYPVSCLFICTFSLRLPIFFLLNYEFFACERN